MAGREGRRGWQLGGRDLEELLAEAARHKGESLWSDAWRRLRKNRASYYSLVFLAVVGLLSLFAPLLPVPSPTALDLQDEPLAPQWAWQPSMRAQGAREDDQREFGTPPTKTWRSLADNGWQHRSLVDFKTAGALPAEGPAPGAEELAALVEEVSGRRAVAYAREHEDEGYLLQRFAVPLLYRDRERVDYEETGREAHLRLHRVQTSPGPGSPVSGWSLWCEYELPLEPAALASWSTATETGHLQLDLELRDQEPGVHGLRYELRIPSAGRSRVERLRINGIDLEPRGRAEEPLDAPDASPAPFAPTAQVDGEGNRLGLVRSERDLDEERGLVHDDLGRRVAAALERAELPAGLEAEFEGFTPIEGYWELGLLDPALIWLRGKLFGLWQTGNLLGTDAFGRDTLARILWGSRISIQVALAATLCSLIVGVTYGAFSGLMGGRIDNLMMRIVDVLYSIPFIFVVIFLITIINTYRTVLADIGIDYMFVFYVVIGLIYWLTMARVVRGQVLSLKNSEFIEAARALGASTPRILFVHLVPNVLSVVIVYLTLTIPAIMLFEAFLTFLGLGVEPPKVSWGMLAKDGTEAINAIKTFWWLVAWPAVAMGSTLLALNILGDGLRDALDPKLRGKD